MDSYPTGPAESVDVLLRAHIEELRKDPFLASATIVYIHEKNTGHSAGRNWNDVVRHYNNTYPLREPKKKAGRLATNAAGNKNQNMAVDFEENDPGVNTTPYSKNGYKDALQFYLKRKLLKIYGKCVTACPYRPNGKAFNDTYRELLEQIQRARPHFPGHRGGSIQPGKVSWSAKLAEDGSLSPSLNDDLVVALAMTLYWVRKIYTMRYPGFEYDKIAI